MDAKREKTGVAQGRNDSHQLCPEQLRSCALWTDFHERIPCTSLWPPQGARDPFRPLPLMPIAGGRPCFTFPLFAVAGPGERRGSARAPCQPVRREAPGLRQGACDPRRAVPGSSRDEPSPLAPGQRRARRVWCQKSAPAHEGGRTSKTDIFFAGNIRRVCKIQIFGEEIHYQFLKSQTLEGTHILLVLEKTKNGIRQLSADFTSQEHSVKVTDTKCQSTLVLKVCPRAFQS